MLSFIGLITLSTIALQLPVYSSIHWLLESYFTVPVIYVIFQHSISYYPGRMNKILICYARDTWMVVGFRSIKAKFNLNTPITVKSVQNGRQTVIWEIRKHKSAICDTKHMRLATIAAILQKERVFQVEYRRTTH